MAGPLVYVFEDSQVDRLYPLTYARAAFELRVGGLTLLERLRRNLGLEVAGVLVRPELAGVIRQRGGGVKDVAVNPAVSAKEGIVLVNGRWLLMKGGAGAWSGGAKGELPMENSAGLAQGAVVWMYISGESAGELDWSKLADPRTLESVLSSMQRISSPAVLINRPWDLFTHQRAAIEEDFASLGAANDALVRPGAHLLNAEKIHLAKGVKVWPGAVLDAEGGAIVVGEGTEIRANAVITGPVAIGEHCVIRNGADIREECSFGPNCRVGGEINGSIFLGNANKQHHGFLGQTIVGEWANLGAGTTTSNVKNTYGHVKMPLNGKDEATGRQFLGSIISDHVKLGIGTYLSTGSVIGFGSHVVVGRPARFVPSFAWVTEKGVERGDFEKIEEIAAIAMGRRHVEFTPADHEMFVRIASEWSVGEAFKWTS